MTVNEKRGREDEAKEREEMIDRCKRETSEKNWMQPEMSEL